MNWWSLELSGEKQESSRHLISVVIPVYNAELWINETLMSVFQQTYEPIEVIVIDDGSSDASRQIVEEIMSRRPKKCLKLISTINSGVSDARNLGIETSRGEVIAFLDSDDIWHHEKLAIQYSKLLEHRDTVAVFCDFYISKLSRRDGKLRDVRLVSKRGVKDVRRSWITLEGNGALISSTGLIWKRAFENQKWFNSQLDTAADLDFFLRLTGVGPIEHVYRPLVQYRQHSNQMHTSSEKLKRDFHKLLGSGEDLVVGLDPKKILGNVYVMASVHNFSQANYQSGMSDLKRGISLRPSAVIRIPVSIIYKRLKGRFMMMLSRKG